MNSDLNIVLTGGGTGGHVIPAVNIGREILSRNPGYKLLYLGGESSLEERLIKQEGWRFQAVTAAALRRGLYLSNLLLPLKMLWSLGQSLKYLSRFKADCVIGTGGYFSQPALTAARLTGRPLFLQEQNAYPGLVTRLFSRRARRIYLGYQDAAKYLKADPSRFKFTGNPVASVPCELTPQAAREKFNLETERFTLFVTGGSGGSRNINNAVAEALEGIQQRGFNLIWQVGKYLPEVVTSGEPTLVGFL
ncbi:MAG: UDP-N-acetylglucosamine--N-acetylmuramyl-(pentapeptide) pyrophosphoryl-undecaprenol N-acetylglucosamine transferase [Calditrichota bacterium]